MVFLLSFDARNHSPRQTPPRHRSDGARGSEESKEILNVACSNSNELTSNALRDCFPQPLLTTLGHTQLSLQLDSCCITLLALARSAAVVCTILTSRLLTLGAHRREQIVMNVCHLNSPFHFFSLSSILQTTMYCIFLQGSEARQSLARHRGLRQDRRFRPLQGGHGLRRQDRHILRHTRVPRAGYDLLTEPTVWRIDRSGVD